MKRLTKEYIKNDSSFPANINMDYYMVVQIVNKPRQSIILYKNLNGDDDRYYLPLSIANRFSTGIKIL